jgi:hypothetical protein
MISRLPPDYAPATSPPFGLHQMTPQCSLREAGGRPIERFVAMPLLLDDTE